MKKQETSAAQRLREKFSRQLTDKFVGHLVRVTNLQSRFSGDTVEGICTGAFLQHGSISVRITTETSHHNITLDSVSEKDISVRKVHKVLSKDPLFFRRLGFTLQTSRSVQKLVNEQRTEHRVHHLAVFLNL